MRDGTRGGAAALSAVAVQNPVSGEPERIGQLFSRVAIHAGTVARGLAAGKAVGELLRL